MALHAFTLVDHTKDKVRAGIVVDFGKKTLKKSALPRKKSTFLAKKSPISQKALLEQKKALSKHYFINKKQQESTYN